MNNYDFNGLARRFGQDVGSATSQAQYPNWGAREDGTPKGNGFLGALQRADGDVSTELSIGVNIDGKDVDVPTLVPTLSQDERNWLLNNDPSDPSKIPPEIVNKAVAFAQQRMAGGKSTFAGKDESPPVNTPRGVTLENLDRFGATPAGRQWVDQLLQRVRGRRNATPGAMQ